MKFLGIVESAETKVFAQKVAEQLGFVEPAVIIGTPRAGAEYIASQGASPNYILIETSSRNDTIISELDMLADYCEQTTKVIIIGEVNDLNFYRLLLQRGVTEYFIKPVQVIDVKNAFFKDNIEKHAPKPTSDTGRVISIMSAASGDGATTIALNTAYMLASELKHKTVLVDMDYQFGMIARNLDITGTYGLKELYDHPEGSIDLTLLEKTLIPYNENLSVIAAPKSLKFVPNISKNIIANLIYILRQRFEYVILDLPHAWSEWMVSTIKEADQNILVAQLWLKSATHSARLLNALLENGVFEDKTSIVINRSGSKFKEAITPVDFAMACKKKVSYYISNDSKTITTAENQGKTAVEIGNSMINRQFAEIANGLISFKPQVR